MDLDLSPLWISAKTAFAATFITFFLGIAAAWFASGCQGRFKGIIDSILTLPMVLPPTVVGFFLLIVLGKNGPLGNMLYSFGIKVIFTWPAAVAAATAVAFPMMYKSAKGALEQVDRNLVYAARTLGASEWKIFWRVSVPLAWPGIAAGTVLSFARALGEFGATLMIAGNIPGKTQTIPLAIFFAAEGGDYDKALIWVVLIFAVSLSAMTAMNYWNDYHRKYITTAGGD